ncbi:MAG: DUF6152 family protein, partial [Gammaproteobacteria bacterium]|nr:DUF6152 family protein [Gammaproteobacteria bacterium]
MKPSLMAVIVAVLAPAAMAHHSDAGVDMGTVVEFDGTVTSYHWRNPHVYFSVLRTEADSQAREW